MSATFDAFFKKATATEQNPAGNAPYDYQRCLACGVRGERSEIAWLSSVAPYNFQLTSISTGLDKTALSIL